MLSFKLFSVSVPAAVVAVLIVCLFLSGAVVSAQTQEKSNVKVVPVRPIGSVAGADLYKAYCASCHGLTGKGDGPVAKAMKGGVPDITGMTKANGGKFPELKVRNSITGDSNVPAHGSADMPVWGLIFRDMSHGRETETLLRLRNVTLYVESLQQK